MINFPSLSYKVINLTSAFTKVLVIILHTYLAARGNDLVAEVRWNRKGSGAATQVFTYVFCVMH